MKAKQFLVIGVGRFGTAVATTLHELGHEVVIVDRNEERVEDLMDKVTHALIADASDEDALKKLGVNSFDAAVVAIGSHLEANILATVALKSLGAPYVISKASSALAAQVLQKVGADEVLQPEYDMGVRLARNIATPSIVDAFNLGKDYGVLEVECTRKLSGELSKLDLTNRFGVQVIVISRSGNVEVSPRADSVIRPGDNLVVVGSNHAVEQFGQYLSE